MMDKPEVWYLIVLLGILLCGGAWRFLRPTQSNFVMLAGWGGIIAILMVVYVLRDELQEIPRRIAAEFGLVSDPQGGAGQLYPVDARGHALIDVVIADQAVVMLLDTGASAVMLGQSDAARLGITPDQSDYRHRVETASGTEYMAKVSLPSLQIGNMLLENVETLISPKGGISLLGMTALSQLNVTLEGNYVQLAPKY